MTPEEKTYLSVLSRKNTQEIVLDTMDAILGDKEQSRQLPAVFVNQLTEGLFFARMVADQIASGEGFRMIEWGIDDSNPLAHFTIGEELSVIKDFPSSLSSLPKRRSFKQRILRAGRISINLPDIFFSVTGMIAGSAMKLIAVCFFGLRSSWLSITGDCLLLIVLSYLAFLLIRQVKRQIL